MRLLQLAHPPLQGVDDGGVCEGGEGGGNRVLVSGLDPQEGRDLAEHSGAPEELGGAVLGGEELGERIPARLPAGALRPGLALDAQQLIDAGARGVSRGHRAGVSVGGSPALLAGSRDTRRGRGTVRGSGLARGSGKIRRRLLGPLVGGSAGAPCSLGLGERRLQARRRGRGIPREPSNLLAVVGDHPVDPRQFARRALVRVLGLLAGAGGLGERAAGGLELPGQLGVLAPRASGPLLQRLGSLTARCGLRCCSHGRLLGGGHERAAQAFRQRRELLPVGGRALQGRRGRPLGILQARQLRTGSRDSFLEGRPQRRRLFVGGLERRQLRARRRQVIRQ